LTVKTEKNPNLVCHKWEKKQGKREAKSYIYLASTGQREVGTLNYFREKRKDMTEGAPEHKLVQCTERVARRKERVQRGAPNRFIEGEPCPEGETGKCGPGERFGVRKGEGHQG